MAMADILANIQDFDFDQLNDFNNVGNWPLAVKIVMWIVAFAGAVALGYFLHITNLQQDLAKVVTREGELRTDYEGKAFQSAHLEGYRRQQLEMEESFGALLRQLPGETEVPGLVDDITIQGIGSGLEFSSIRLEQELQQEFYIELPINISVVGDYHDFGAFVSGVASLSRIVTLHDFEIITGSATSRTDLSMNITARTYRYNTDDE